jgi:hypothetical protein
MTSSAPALDPLLDLVGLRDAQDGDGGHRRRPADLAADVGGALLAGDDVEDDELVVGGLLEGLARIGDGGDGVADAGQDAGDRLGRRGVRGEEQDGAGGHGASERSGWMSGGCAEGYIAART